VSAAAIPDSDYHFAPAPRWRTHHPAALPEMTTILQPTVRRALLAVAAIALAACTGLQPANKPGVPGQATAAPAPKPPGTASYFEVLDLMAPGDAVRQSTELASTLAQAQQDPTSSNRLRYAIALGAAGHVSSNPVEARRLITELLAGQNDLTPQELSLANAFLREFDARVALYADLARLREESESQMKSIDADDDRRYSALNAETQRLKKALAEAERKLEAVAEMERALTPEGQ
jgi:plasmid stability protein